VKHMSYMVRVHETWASRIGALAALAALSAASCGRPQKPPEAGVQATFSSPEDAGSALVAAAKSGDESTLVTIFGPGSKSVWSAGDAAADRARMDEFVTSYNHMHRWGKIKARDDVLRVGLDNYPFPIPLAQNSAGRWYFDTAAGKDEILARRIGRNELTATDASDALGTAQHQYFQETPTRDKVKQYAQKFVSDPGKHNGLYWPVAEGQTPSPLGRFGDFTNVLSSTQPGSDLEFNGYRYRILSKAATPRGTTDYVIDGKMTGGFAILAYPVEYRNSGIMSFLIGEDGTLYQKDLGERTADVAAAMTDYNPADGWTAANGLANTAARAEQ
jgi:Protein of unknown function (DUF2950)